jgi:arabinofuranosyltransferase
MAIEDRAAHRAAETAAVTLAVSLYAVACVRHAWISDDAYITFRTVDNVVNGYGLRWNVIERVQTYTHPLWMLLLIVPHAILREPYVGTLVLSLSFSLGSVVFLARMAQCRILAATAIVALASSTASADYSTSGLENPLAHALIVVLVWLAARPQPSVMYVSAVTAACILTRFDLALLVLPLWMAAVVRARAMPLRARAVAVLAAPLGAWELFSLLYYGFPFPNTAYAKVATGIDASALHQQGLAYLTDSLQRDPLTLIVIAAGVSYALARRQLPIAAGAVLYITYVVLIGGDFMSGRFLTTPLILVVASAIASASIRRVRWNLVVPALPAVVAFLAGRPAFLTGAESQASELSPPTIYRGIVDERRIYYESTGLLPVVRGARPAAQPWAATGLGIRSVPQVIVYEAVGLLGYHAGPGVHIIDPLGITDPLLARRPALPEWRIGHFRREVPVGYVESVRMCVERSFPGGRVQPPSAPCEPSIGDGTNQVRNPSLARFYERLATITQAPVWRADRLRLIWRVNAGLRDD